MNFVNKLFRFYGNEQKEKKEEEKNDMNNSDKALNDIKYAQYQINDMKIYNFYSEYDSKSKKYVSTAITDTKQDGELQMGSTNSILGFASKSKCKDNPVFEFNQSR